MSCHPPAPRAFTLIELLVVVGIISVLMGILLPSINSARDKAKTMRCMSNLKAIGGATGSYLNDYDNTLYPACADTLTPGLEDGFSDWSKKKLFEYISNRTGGTWPQLRNTIFNCPSWRSGFELTGATETQPNSAQVQGYAKNRLIGLPTYNSAPYSGNLSRINPFCVKVVTIDSPSMTFLAIDATWSSVSDLNTDCQIASYRHNRGLNVLYLDGHAEWSAFGPRFPFVAPSGCLPRHPTDPLGGWAFWVGSN